MVFTFFWQIQPIEFTKDDAELLFGPDADYKAAFEELDTDEDGEVRMTWLTSDTSGYLIFTLNSMSAR